jgi:hypothetical protein
MAHYVPLSKAAHRDAGLNRTGFGFALEQIVVPLVAEELPLVLPTMVIAFVPLDDAGTGFEVVALQSLGSGVNAYVHPNGQWIGGYRPAWYRAHPFKMMRDDQNDRDLLCVDVTSAAFAEAAGKGAVKLFDDNGEPSQCARDVVAFLEKLKSARRLTRAKVTQLDEAGLIAPWPTNTGQPDSEADQQARGLYRIEEVKLRELDPEVLKQLARSGALSMAYAQLLSEHRLRGLASLNELRQKANEKASAKAEPSDLDLDDLFGDNDGLSFDF